MPSPTAVPWWTGPRFDVWFLDAIAGELDRLGRRRTELVGLTDDLPMNEDGFGLDSLERLRLSAALSGRLEGDGSTPDRFERLEMLSDWREEARRLATLSMRIGFRTSGSTGRPKLVRHGLDVLMEEVEELFALTRPEVVEALVPAHHIYGFLFTVLLPLRAGAVICDGRVEGGSEDEADPRAPSRRLIVAAPPHVQALADRGRSIVAGTTIVCSGGVLAADAAAEVSALGAERVIEIYGSTETGGIGWRDRRESPYRLFERWDRCGMEQIVRRSDPAAHAIELPDLVVFDDERHLRPLSRRDQAVMVGGVTVHPTRIAAVIAQHPGVADVLVRPMRPHEGDRLKAFVVPAGVDTECEDLRRDLEVWCAIRLTAPERPKSWTFGARLPVDGRGKPVDWMVG